MIGLGSRSRGNDHSPCVFSDIKTSHIVVVVRAANTGGFPIAAIPANDGEIARIVGRSRLMAKTGHVEQDRMALRIEGHVFEVNIQALRSVVRNPSRTDYLR